MFTELFPIVGTPDLPRALGFYRDALGGTVTHRILGSDGSPVYVGVDIGSSHIGIGRSADADGAAVRPVSIWVYADDCDAAVDRLRSAGVTVVEPPADQPTGDRIAKVLDPDGNEIVIARQSDAKDELDSVGAGLLSPEPERYTRHEYERRFVVAPDAPWRGLVESHSKRFEDVYIRATHLRLRTLSDSASGREFIKLTKKLESASPYVQMTGSIPLSPMEYELLAELEGDRITKARYYHYHGRHVFSIDVFEGALAGLVMCEVETGSEEELMRIEPPDYVLAEVTEDAFFTGGKLSRTSREDLAVKLATLGG